MFKEILEKILERVKALGAKDLSEIDLTSLLDERAKGTGLEWKTSVVDFLKLIGAPNSSEARAALGEDLGVVGTPGDASYNEALRKAVFKKIAENGGNIPASLL